MSALEYPPAPSGDALAHALLGRLDRQTELLAEIAGVLAPKVLRPSLQDVVGAAQTIAYVDFPVPGGVNVIYELQRITFWSNTAQANPAGALYVMDAVPLNPRTVAFDAGYLEEGPWSLKAGTVNEGAAPIIAKGGEHLLVQWSGLVAGDQIKVGLQLRQAWQAQD